MVKTAALDDDAHMNVKDIQMILYRDYNIRMNISDILSFVLKDPDDVVKRIVRYVNDNVHKKTKYVEVM